MTSAASSNPTRSSVSLLWRSFTASTAALWSSHWFDDLLSGEDTKRGHTSSHTFDIIFRVGRADSGCATTDGISLAVVGLAVLGGIVGALFNLLLLRTNRLRARKRTGSNCPQRA